MQTLRRINLDGDLDPRERTGPPKPGERPARQPPAVPERGRVG